MTMPTRESVIASMQEAADRMGLDLEDLQEMIEDVLEDCSNKSVLLKEAITSKDAAIVKAIAHDIKGSTANYGLQQVSDLAYNLEKGHEDPAMSDIDHIIALLEHISGLNLSA